MTRKGGSLLSYLSEGEESEGPADVLCDWNFAGCKAFKAGVFAFKLPCSKQKEWFGVGQQRTHAVCFCEWYAGFPLKVLIKVLNILNIFTLQPIALHLSAPRV